MSEKLTFTRMQTLCALRLSELTAKYGPDHGENWTANDWFTAFAGEAGELGNLLKKIRRGDLQYSGQTYDDVGAEYADTMAYLLYLGNKLNIDVAQVIIDKWNVIGKRLDLQTNMDDDGNLVRRK